MAFWITLRDQLIALWNRWTIAQRVGISTAAAACAAAIIGTMIWAAQPDYVVIASQLTPQRATEIAGILDTEKIGYSLNFSGSAVSVASSDVASARMALASILSPENEADVPAAGLFPGSPGEEEDRRRAGLEKQIERAIKRIRGIVSATVKISRPNPSPFITDQTPVTAAVVIEPRAGDTISAGTANSIIAIVAGSVPGLKTDNIVMTDNTGRQYGGHTGTDDLLASQMNFRQQKEAYFVHKIESHLNRIRGVQASVVVAAEIDFNQRTTTSNKIDAEGKAKISNKLNSIEQKGSRLLPIGTAGASSNVPAGAIAQNDGSTGSYKTEDIDEAFVYPESQEEVKSIGGDILRLSVSAVVDLTNVSPPGADTADTAGNAGSAGNTGVTAATSLTKEDIEKLIKSAMGFDETRNDQVDVTLAALEPIDTGEPATPGFIWEKWQPLLQSVSLGLAATLAFLIGMMLMKRMKPIVITEATGRGIPLADARRLATISEQAKAHPEVVASILTAWLNEQESGSTNDKPDNAPESVRTPTGPTSPRTANSAAKAA
ncbi:MAG: flagellar M-ring protein FliF [Planctomycetaceae bacterium]|nr:flagellar M-ring protein FliF [Planctomycetaceae bacterium]